MQSDLVDILYIFPRYSVPRVFWGTWTITSVWHFGFETYRFGNFLIFLDGIGIGFGKFCYRKSIGIGFEKNWYRKKYRYRFRKILILTFDFHRAIIPNPNPSHPCIAQEQERGHWTTLDNWCGLYQARWRDIIIQEAEFMKDISTLPDHCVFPSPDWGVLHGVSQVRLFAIIHFYMAITSIMLQLANI